MVKKVDILEHSLVPAIRILEEEEIETLLKKYSVNKLNLPRMTVKDAVSQRLRLIQGQVIEIVRKSPTNEITKFYRVIV